MTTDFTKYTTKILEKMERSLEADWAGIFSAMFAATDAEEISRFDYELFKIEEILEQIEDVIQGRYFHS